MRAMSNTHRLPVRVYWEDTDAGGVVYHASYLRFMERGRTELLRECGIDQSTILAERGLTFVVARMEIDFRKPGRIDDQLVVETAIAEMGRGSLRLAQTVMRGADVLAEAEVVCAVLSHATGKSARIPPDLKAKLGG